MESSFFSAVLLKLLPKFLTSDSTQKMLDTGDADTIRIILNDLKLPKDPNNTDYLSLATVPPYIFNTTLMDVFLPIAEGVFNEDMTDLNPEFIKSIGEETHKKLLAIAKDEELVNTLLSAFVNVYTNVIRDQFKSVYPETNTPKKLYNSPLTDDELDISWKENADWKKNKNTFEKEVINQIAANVSIKFLSSLAPPFKPEHELMGLTHLKNITNQCIGILNQEKRDNPAQQKLGLLLKDIDDELQKEIDTLNQGPAYGEKSKLDGFITQLEEVATTLSGNDQKNKSSTGDLSLDLLNVLNTIKAFSTLNRLSAFAEDSTQKLSGLKSICNSKATINAVAKAERDLIAISNEINNLTKKSNDALKSPHLKTTGAMQEDLLKAVQKFHEKLETIGKKLKKIEEKPIKSFAEWFLNKLIRRISFGRYGYEGSEKNNIKDKNSVAAVNHTMQRQHSKLKNELNVIRAAHGEETNPNKPRSPGSS